MVILSGFGNPFIAVHIMFKLTACALGAAFIVANVKAQVRTEADHLLLAARPGPDKYLG